MVFNETKVVPARMFFQRETGAHIEIFCLEPVSPPEYNTIFAATVRCSWKCVVGNLKRWKNDVLSLINTADDKDIAELSLRASLVKKEGNTAVVEFTWNTGVPFSRVLDMAGKVPIPPYLNRDTEDIDLERYQTLYARVSGSVAAPTAGLHFTQRVLEGISAKGIDINKVCLHVGAGTFLPVKSSNVADHPMHREPFSVGIGLLRKLRDRKVPLIAVGTTSVRTLESLYYAGVDCIEKGAPEDIGQWVPYEREYPYSTEEALKALVEY
jgi:S-adenosylmethionine:tRNA ribosyltransferase-isomerase